jgi:hypothetical protein
MLTHRSHPSRRRLLRALALLPGPLLVACGEWLAAPTPTLVPVAPTATALPTAVPATPTLPPVGLPPPPFGLTAPCEPVAAGRPVVCGAFLEFWRRRGGLDQFGVPLAPTLGEQDPASGDPLTVQYFERARFETRVDAPSPEEVMLGLLGREATRDRADEVPFLAVPDPGDGSWFPETRHTLTGRFRAHWEAPGGLARYGFPISEEFDERLAADGPAMRVQYLERARFEHHPQHAGTRYEVQLGLLGRDVFQTRYGPS